MRRGGAKVACESGVDGNAGRFHRHTQGFEARAVHHDLARTAHRRAGGHDLIVPNDHYSNAREEHVGRRGDAPRDGLLLEHELVAEREQPGRGEREGKMCAHLASAASVRRGALSRMRRHRRRPRGAIIFGGAAWGVGGHPLDSVTHVQVDSLKGDGAWTLACNGHGDEWGGDCAWRRRWGRRGRRR